MSKIIALKAEKRDAGTQGAVKLRKAGQMPAVVYGHKRDAVSVSVDGKALTESLHHGNQLFKLEIDGVDESVIVKNIQFDYLGKDVIHVDFMYVNLDEKITTSVPIVLKGVAVGAGHGGTVEDLLNSIEIECLATNIPEEIDVKIKKLEVGDTIYAKDVKLPEGVTLVTDPDAPIVACHQAKAAKSEDELAAEEMPDGPEVITEKNREED